ncbi:MAG: hypothetical protein ACI4JR_05780 [Acutalibacteraceae bacterium]
MRIMQSVDISDEATQRIINNCSHRMSGNHTDIKVPAIAAVSCAAVAAVAVVGIPRLRRRNGKKG